MNNHVNCHPFNPTSGPEKYFLLKENKLSNKANEQPKTSASQRALA